MSRIIVKNLPNKVTEDDLKEKFSETGVITDVQLKFTKDGKFRHFAFIGFETEQQAASAIQYFDKSFFRSVRMNVEACAALGSENKPKAWSKYAPDSSAYKKLHKIEQETKPKSTHLKEESINPILKELMDKNLWKFTIKIIKFGEVMISTSKNKNDINLKTGKKTIEEIHKETKNKITERKYFTLVVRGIPYKAKKKEIKEFFQPLKVDSIRVPPKIKGLAYIGFKNEDNMKKALLRNRSFMGWCKIITTRFKNELYFFFNSPIFNKNINNINNNDNEKWRYQEESLTMEEDIAESGRIFVRNLPYTTTEEELQPIFEKYGPITEVIVPLDKLTRKIKGYALVTFLLPENAVKAYTALDGTIFHGRMLHLLPGKAKEADEINIKEGSSFKTKKMQTLKTEAGSSHNWNTLFLGSNAVADLIASTYKISKEKLLCDDNAAVRLALGETKIIHETKEFLELNGVKLDVFNRVLNHRSKTIILVKNLPANTKPNEIRELFSKYGILGRVVLPPNGITGIVEFIEPSEARTAFRHLAYSKFKNIPLYLEWAPENIFLNSSTENDEENKKEVFVYIFKNKDSAYNSNNDEPEPDTTLFIKNLNFETTEENIREHFRSCGKIADVTVAKKKDPKKPNGFLSMGYGFIQFYTQRALNTALKTLQQTMLDNHCIELKRSNRTLKSQNYMDRKVNNVEKQNGSKILVRNIPFQAKSNELKDLFKTFGDIKAVRLPKKMVGTGPHRGFAFVEYFSKEDAKRAMQSLCQSTHLYGRRLVLEWAQSAEEDLEQIRKRTAERFPMENDNRNKKSKANIIIEKSDDDLDEDGIGDEEDDNIDMYAE
ncbi:hypothetical protein PGB90_008044 [Kerria lacca]